MIDSQSAIDTMPAVETMTWGSYSALVMLGYVDGFLSGQGFAARHKTATFACASFPGIEAGQTVTIGADTFVAGPIERFIVGQLGRMSLLPPDYSA